MMKNALLIFLALSMGSFAYAQSVFGGEQTSLNLVAETAPAKATWEQNQHNFGEIPYGEPVSYMFVVKNTGETPLVIKRVKPSCSCSVAEYTEDPIAPGKTGFVKATYKANSTGVFSKTITVTTNEENPNTILRMRGEVMKAPQR